MTTLRDQIAIAALQNLGPIQRDVTAEEATQIAADAYAIANAMLAVRAAEAEAAKPNRTRIQ